MTSITLSFGCTLIAFCPLVILLLLLVNKNPYLTMITTISAFFQLLSALLSSILYFPLRFLKRNTSICNLDLCFIILSSISSQNICRYLFLKLYRIVESHLLSIFQNTREDKKLLIERGETAGTLLKNEKNHTDQICKPDSDISGSVAQLSFELNDVTSALAAGVGYGGMHAVILYGTLLVSQFPEKNTFFRSSCQHIPILIPTAIVTCLFSVLDVMWMFIFFYAIRYKKLELRNSQTRSSRKVNQISAILVVIFSHVLASFSTVMNNFISKNGCYLAIISLFIVVVATISFFCKFIIYWLILDVNSEARQNSVCRIVF